MTTWFWRYNKQSSPFPYGPDDTYKAAAKFLDYGPIEDWGCGTAYAKKFFPNGYLGIDMAPGFADVQADLARRVPSCDNVLLRHVLEHNFNWREILNAAASVRKLAVVIFTPFGNETKIINWSNNGSIRVPDISFRKQDLTAFFDSYEEEIFSNDTQYGTETIFKVTQR